MENVNITVLLILRLINIILITSSMCGFIISYFINRRCWVIAPITWLLHVLVYGIYRFIIVDMNTDTYIFVQNWTALVLMHGIVLLVALAYLSINFECKQKERT